MDMSIKTEIAQYSVSNHSGPPPYLGKRYDTEKFLPEAGNTVVCHLDFNALAHTAILDARKRMRALPGADRFLYTPVSSLHMTLFEGVLDSRRIANTWPADLGENATVDAATQSILARLTEFSPPADFAARVVGLRPSGLLLAGATAQDDANMRAWRAALTQPFGYRHDSHDLYRFHMTFAYPIEWISESDRTQWEVECASILEDLAEAAPVIPLKPPAFCKFADMEQFDELLVLGG